MHFAPTTSCQKECYNYCMSHEVQVPPRDCAGLLGTVAVKGAAGEGNGYIFQICPKASEQGKHARRIISVPDNLPHIIILNRQEMPAAEELRQKAARLDVNPTAHEGIY